MEARFWLNQCAILVVSVSTATKYSNKYYARGAMSTQFATVGEVLLKYLPTALGDQFTKEMVVGSTRLLDTMVFIIKENNHDVPKKLHKLDP